MNKLSCAAILILSSAWTLASAGALPADENPSSSTQSTQQSDKSQTAVIEGCVSGSVDSVTTAGNVDSFILTDAHGKRYELTGDPNLLIDRVGHKVRVLGHTDNVTEAELITAGQPHAAFEVQEVHSLSGACK